MFISSTLFVLAVIPTRYSPKHFGREYYDIKGDSQYSMFAAVALGVKPSFDDWIPVEHYPRFLSVCSKYDLVVEPNVLFVEPDGDKDAVVGGRNITTTFFVGKQFRGDEKRGQVHVFVAKTKEQAWESKKFGWYAVVINGRSTNKPFVDHLRFGLCLGYPPCCVEFFCAYNNWDRYSHPFETVKNTPMLAGRATGSYHCNNFLMDHVFFFIHHLPCSYRCERTISVARQVEEALLVVEPEYVQQTIELLKKPLLVFGEKHFVLFDGRLTRTGSKQTIHYRDCSYFENPARPEERVPFFDSIREGDTLTVEHDSLIISRGTATLRRVEKKSVWFAIDFD
jgi:hypothetical protein